MDLATLQRMHPDWNVVDFKESSNGGLWALGRDGGVFSLDATGGTTGLTAPYLGSYTGLPADQRQGSRTFTRLDVNQSGGYNLVSANQENYGFNPTPHPLAQLPPGQTTTGTQQATDATPQQAGPNLSGSAALHAVLDPLGLGSMADAGLAELAKPGADVAYVTQVWLPQQQQYKDAFPEIAAAQAKNAGGTPTHIPTPAEIVGYHQGVQGMVDQGLLPPEFATRDKVSGLINGGVSLSEFQNRVLNGVDQFMNADPADQQAFLAYHPAVDFSHAVGALLDPTLSQAAVTRAITQAQIGGSAIRSGFGPISAGQATALEQAGLTGSSAARPLEQAALQGAVTQTGLGEDNSVTRSTQLGSIAGNAADQAAIDRRIAQRQAGFQGGGGAGGTSGRGGTGLGSSAP